MSNLKIYNTLTRKKEEFKPIKKGKVGIYTCGPTVYNHAHIGNLRAYTFADTLVRVLKYLGNNVKWVMNITDIEDKIIRDYKKSGKTIEEFTAYYEKILFEESAKTGINLKHLNEIPHATKFISEMQEIIKLLLDKGIAYIQDGSIYFSISKYIESGHKYGKLMNIDLEHFQKGERIEADEYEKDNVKDFSLWKEKKDNEPSWDFEIEGKNYPGRPGWHIECSAMSRKYLGNPFDIHTGGVDLIFPHHENEIAQTEGAYGVQIANYFLHNEHLLVNGQKMSKSLGNFYVLDDVLKFIKNPLSLRYLFLSSHYRSKLNFTEDSIKSAENTLYGIYEFVLVLKTKEFAGLGIDVFNINEIASEIKEALIDDLNTPLALGILHSKIFSFKSKLDELSQKQANELLAYLIKIDEILGLNLDGIKKEEFSKEDELMIDKREDARKRKDWATADRIRDDLLKQGIEIEDTPEGPKAKKIK